MTLEKLKNIAMAATKGPWSVKSGTQLRSEKDQIAKVWMMRNGEGKCNGEHIATFNPTTVLALLDALEEAKKALEFYGDVDNWNSHEHSYPGCPVIDEDDEEKTNQHVWHGGKNARQALAAIEERLGSIGGV